MTDIQAPSQDAREAAAAWLTEQGERFPSRASEAMMVRAGEYDHHSLVQAFARFEAHLRSTIAARDGETYAEWQQKRGMLADHVDWAINEYDEFMKDDAYDSQRVLDRIIARLRETRDIARIDTLTSAAQDGVS